MLISTYWTTLLVLLTRMSASISSRTSSDQTVFSSTRYGVLATPSCSMMVVESARIFLFFLFFFFFFFSFLLGVLSPDFHLASKSRVTFEKHNGILELFAILFVQVRVFVTHQVGLLNQCDSVVVLKDGFISEVPRRIACLLVCCALHALCTSQHHIPSLHVLQDVCRRLKMARELGVYFFESFVYVCMCMGQACIGVKNVHLQCCCCGAGDLSFQCKLCRELHVV